VFYDLFHPLLYFVLTKYIKLFFQLIQIKSTIKKRKKLYLKRLMENL